MAFSAAFLLDETALSTKSGFFSERSAAVHGPGNQHIRLPLGVGSSCGCQPSKPSLTLIKPSSFWMGLMPKPSSRPRFCVGVTVSISSPVIGGAGTHRQGLYGPAHSVRHHSGPGIDGLADDRPCLPAFRALVAA